MPGTIQVSVLGFVGFPSSSPHSSMSLKVSMGKREFQTWNRGEFFFPLTSLCDLIITLLDAEGNAISHTGVKTTLVIEKGLWEDIFPLEGGGHVHMKVQFFLSEEDHNRIQILRDSALKKKYGEYVGRCQFSDVADMVKCDKISDSKACLPDLQAINTAEVSIQSNQSTYPNASCKDPQYGDRSEEQSLTVSASQAVETKITKRGIEEKRITVSPENGKSEQALMTTPASQQVKPNINEREMVVNTMILSSEVCPLEEHLDLEQSEERQEQTQSTVRKMIHALEGSSLQNVEYHINTSAINSQSSNIKKEICTKDPCLKDYKTGKTTPTPQSSDIPTDESLETFTNIKKRWERCSFSRAQDKTFYTRQCIATVKEDRKFPQNLIKIDIIDSAKSIGVTQNDDCNNSIEGISNSKSKSLAYNEGSRESSSAWIFPDEEKHLCITTGGKNVMVLIEDCSLREKNHQGDANLTEQDVDLGDNQKISSNPRKKNVETAGGPVGQAINMIIMVGFGLLVLLTRRRETR